MPLLIDGHNVIGAGVFEDIRLQDEDDERRLVDRLRVWKSRYPGTITVVFDHGITEGASADLSGGGVRVIFARTPQEADDLIRQRLQRPTRGLVLVTGDAALRREAAAHRVPVWRPHELVERLGRPRPVRRSPAREPGTEEQPMLSAQEVAEWERLFAARARERGRAQGRGSSRSAPRRP